MANLDELRDLLVSEFQNNHIFSCSPNGDRLEISCMWSNRLIGISQIEVCIEGIHPLTGKPLSKKDYSFIFASGKQQYSMKHTLYGLYTLTFTAYLHDGTVLKNFVTPVTYRFENMDAKPYIHYSVVRGPKGFTKVTIDSNCFARLNRCLWVCIGSARIAVPEMLSSHYSVCFASQDPVPTVICIESGEDRSLPTPVKVGN